LLKLEVLPLALCAVFAMLHACLREHVYQHGGKSKPNELVERATGGQMSVRPYLAYLRAKYGEHYQLTAAEKHWQAFFRRLIGLHRFGPLNSAREALWLVSGLLQ
jgi:Carboxypeptidase Taq (M32) metallopeptidase